MTRSRRSVALPEESVLRLAAGLVTALIQLHRAELSVSPAPSTATGQAI
jgi:hypothetical protein